MPSGGGPGALSATRPLTHPGARCQRASARVACTPHLAQHAHQRPGRSRGRGSDAPPQVANGGAGERTRGAARAFADEAEQDDRVRVQARGDGEEAEDGRARDARRGRARHVDDRDDQRPGVPEAALRHRNRLGRGVSVNGGGDRRKAYE
jgi:hypothetical protein